MWGSSFHRMLDAETFRLVVEDDFRVLAFMSRVVRSTWLLYVYFVLVFLGQVVAPFYWKASAAWWASGPARRRALDACRTWTGLLARSCAAPWAARASARSGPVGFPLR